MRDLNQLSTPINKTAALVVNQSGCEKETEFVKLSREIENIKLSMAQVEQAIREEKSKKKKKELGRWKWELQNKLIPIKNRIKVLNVQKHETMNALIVRECMTRFSEKEWEEITSIAKQKFRRYEL